MLLDLIVPYRKTADSNTDGRSYDEVPIESIEVEHGSLGCTRMRHLAKPQNIVFFFAASDIKVTYTKNGKSGHSPNRHLYSCDDGNLFQIGSDALASLGIFLPALRCISRSIVGGRPGVSRSWWPMCCRSCELAAA